MFHYQKLLKHLMGFMHGTDKQGLSRSTSVHGALVKKIKRKNGLCIPCSFMGNKNDQGPMEIITLYEISLIFFLSIPIHKHAGICIQDHTLKKCVDKMQKHL